MTTKSLLTAKPYGFQIGLPLLLAAGAQTVLADSATWTGTTDRDWQKTANWGGAAQIPGASQTATFANPGNGNTAITNIPSMSVSNFVFNAGTAAYTFTGTNNTWTAPDGGGITVNSGVTTVQDLTGISFLRAAANATINVTNVGSANLRLGTLFATTAAGNLRVNLVPGTNSMIEIATGKLVNNAAANRTSSLLVNGPGMVKMSGSGSYTGPDAEGNGLTIHQGIFSAPSLNSIGGYYPAGSGRIQFGQAGQALTGTMQITGLTTNTIGQAIYIMDGNTASFDITNAASNLILSSNLTQSAATLGGGNVTKVGAGTLTLAGTNLYSGTTLVAAGTLYLSNNFALTNSPLDPAGAGTLVLDPSATTPTFGGLTGAANFTLSTNITTLTLNPFSGKTVVYAGILNGGFNNSLALIKSGAGRQTLSGSNAFTGNVTINAGPLQLANSYALGTTAKGLIMQGAGRVLELAGGTSLPDNITLYLSSNSYDGGGVNNVSGNNVILGPIFYTSGNPALNISSAAGSLNIAGNLQLTVAAATTRILFLGGASPGTNVISGVISQNGAGGNSLPVTKQGSTTWLLAGANTYNGNTLVTAGNLILSNNLALQDSAFDTTGAGTLTLDASMTTPTFGGLTGPNGFDLPATVTNLTLNPGAGASPALAGGLSGGTALALTKTGPGTQTLAGVNPYTGNTTINAGTLALGGTGSLPNTPVITVNAGSVLDVSGAAFALGAAQTLTGGGTVNGDMTANGTLLPGSPAATLTFNNNLTINGNLGFALNKALAPSSGGIQVLGNVSNTGFGTLTVTNAGPALVAGDKFTLFNQLVPNGQNLTIVPPAGVTFTNQLAIDGSITVLTVPALVAPTLSYTNTGAGSLQFSWTGSFKLQAQTNTLGTGLGTNWGDYSGGGTSPVNVTVDAAQGSVFFRLAPQP